MCVGSPAAVLCCVVKQKVMVGREMKFEKRLARGKCHPQLSRIGGSRSTISRRIPQKNHGSSTTTLHTSHSGINGTQELLIFTLDCYQMCEHSTTNPTTNFATQSGAVFGDAEIVPHPSMHARQTSFLAHESHAQADGAAIYPRRG